MLKTQEQAAEAVQALRRARGTIKLAEIKCAAAIAELSATAEAERDEATAAARDQAEALEIQLERWAREDRASWGKKKSKKVGGGTVGFKAGTDKLEVLTDKAPELVGEELGMDYVRMKPELEIVSIKALNLPDERLLKCGLRWARGEESFFVKA